MKWKKLFALALAGVMALALFTGCSGGGGKSEAALMEENIGNYIKDMSPDVEVTYNIPELTKTIRPDFTRENWYDGGNQLLPEKYAFLQETLKKYEQDIVIFYAFDATEYDVYMQSLMINAGAGNKQIYGPDLYNTPVKITAANIAICHKTINGRKYCLAVVVYEWESVPTVIQ